MIPPLTQDLSLQAVPAEASIPTGRKVAKKRRCRLRMIEMGLTSGEEIGSLMSECDELVRILSKIIQSARAR